MSLESPSPIVVRPASPSDEPWIAALLEGAFPTAAEARLVERLRAAGRATIELVAELEELIVGHILFSPVSLDSRPAAASGMLGLAPVAVLPSHQWRGIGSTLIRAGLAQSRAWGAPFVVVLGEPQYYARFGFVRAADFGLGNEYGADEEFRVAVFDPAAIPAGGGLVSYSSEFADL